MTKWLYDDKGKVRGYVEDETGFIRDDKGELRGYSVDLGKEYQSSKPLSRDDDYEVSTLSEETRKAPISFCIDIFAKVAPIGIPALILIFGGEDTFLDALGVFVLFVVLFFPLEFLAAYIKGIEEEKYLNRKR